MTIVLNPWSSGKGQVKSIATESQRPSGTGRGRKGPPGLIVLDLLRWHSSQEGIYACSVLSACRVGFRMSLRRRSSLVCHVRAERASYVLVGPPGRRGGR